MAQSDDPMYTSHVNYEDQLNKGLKLAGDTKEYFAKGRVTLLRTLWLHRRDPIRILDFGSGDGSTLPYLRAAFPSAHLVAAEPSPVARGVAAVVAAEVGAKVVEPRTMGDLAPYDLVYVNGVLHHVPPSGRPALMTLLASICSTGGRLVIFENNPWNPGARLVMRRIPFDRGTVMVWPHQLRKALRSVGFDDVVLGSLFFFPHSAASAPMVETTLRRTLFGAQYFCSAGNFT